MIRIRLIVDLACIVLMVSATAYILHQERALHASHQRENEMSAALLRSRVLANRLDKQALDWEEAATNYSQAAANFRQAALSCLAKQREIWEPLLDQKAFNTTTPTWKLPLGVMEKSKP